MQTATGRAPDRKTAKGRREHSRAPFSMPLQLRPLYGSAVHGMSLDICEGGVGALVEGKLSVGEAVLIELPMGTQKLTTVAIVRHTSNARAGLQFLRLTDTQRQQITQLVGTA